MKPIHLRIQNYYSQTGIRAPIYFMWEYEKEENYQTAYEIIISKDPDFDKIVYSSNKVLSSEQNNIKVSIELEALTGYYYKVKVWDKDGRSTKSKVEKFITGVHSWCAQWISNKTSKPFYLRKKFVLKETPQDAVMAVCGLGQFEVEINGKTIKDDPLKGSWTDFNKRVEYYTYDISDLLQIGENEVFAEAANGWYIGDTSDKRHFYTIDKGYKAYGKYLPFICEINIDGIKIMSDSSWEVLKSATTLANVYGSEDFDGEYYSKINCMNWDKACILKNTDQPQGKLVPVKHPYVTTKKAYDVVGVTNSKENTYIFDFGQNMSGQFEIKVKGRRGDVIRVIPVEKLDESGNIEKTTQTWSEYTLSGNEDLFKPRFSYVGARWIQVENCTVHKDDKKLPIILSTKGNFITSSAKDVGFFKCSDERYNKIYNLILKAIESNLHHCHTDCPTIEKLGWLEPDHLMGKAVMYNKDVDTLWSKIANDMRDAQYTEEEFDIDHGSFPHEYKEGLVPSIAPRYAKFITDWNHSGSFWDSIPWGSSIILAAWEQYLFYGNKSILYENYQAAKKYIEYLTQQYNDYNRLYHKNGIEKFICSGLGDWGITQNGGNSRENIETAFYYHDINIFSRIAKIVGEDVDNKYFSGLSEDIRRQYNNALLKKNQDTGLWCYFAYDTEGFKVTQANQALPLCFGIVPEDKKNEVQQSLIKACECGHFISGEIGLPYIFRALSEMKRNDIIHKMITNEEHPSYLRFIQKGETTLPEFWRDDARSRNHDMMGHIMEWFFTEVAGIKSDDGFKTIYVNDGIMPWIDWVECEYHSIRGRVYIKKKKGEKTVLEIPANSNYIFARQ